MRRILVVVSYILFAALLLSGCGRDDSISLRGIFRTRPPFPDRASEVVFGVRSIGGPEEIHWLDNDRILFVGYRVLDSMAPDGGRHETEALPSIYIWNVRTDTYERHATLPQYWWICFNRGFIGYATKYEKNNTWHGWKAGTLGKEEDIPDQLATNDKALAPCVGWPREFRPPDNPNAIAIELSPSDGYISIADGPTLANAITRENQDKPVELVRPGATRPIELPIWKKEMEGLAPLRFSVFAEKYVLVPLFERHHQDYWHYTPWPRDQPIPIYLISHDGRVDVVVLPAGSPIPYGVYPTRRGLVWASNNAPSGNSRQAGAWIIENGRVHKLFDHMVSAVGVSPDGCRVAYAVNDYDPRTNDVVHLMDVCSGPTDTGH